MKYLLAMLAIVVAQAGLSAWPSAVGAHAQASSVNHVPNTTPTWSELSDPWSSNYSNQIWSVKIGPNGDVYVASNGGLAVSSDGGNTWSHVGGLTNVTAFGFNSLGEPVAASSTSGTSFVGVYRYTNGQWVASSGVSASLRVTEMTSDGTGALVCCTAWGGNVYRSTDGGSTWTDITGDLPAGTGALWTIACGPNGTLYTGGEMPSGLWSSVNEGVSWSNLGFSSSQGYTNNLFSIAFDGSGYALVASMDHNSGISVSRLVNGTPVGVGIGLPYWDNCHGLVVDGTGAITAAIVGGVGSVYRSTDGGASWSVLGTGYPGGGAENIAEDSAGNVYVNVNLGTGFAIYKLAAAGGGSGGSNATHFLVSAPTTSTVGTAFTFTVTALTSGNTTDTGYTGTIHFTSTDQASQLPANSTLTNGVGSFTATLNTVGNQSITATDTTASSVTGDSGAIAVGSGATHFSVSAPSTGVTGQSVSITVTALTGLGATASQYSGTVHFTSTDPSAHLPSNSTLTNGTGTFAATFNTAGSQTVTATDTAVAGIIGTSSSVRVSTATSGASAMNVFPSGLQMISAPADFTGNSISQMFSPSGEALAVWQPSSNEYAVSPATPADTIRPGAGYWVRFVAATTLYDIGTHTDSSTPFDISLSVGWNMIGDPFATSVPLTSLQVTSGGTTTSFAGAAQEGVVGATIYTYPAGASAYQVESSALQPFVGYWVLANQACTLAVPGS